MVFGHDVGEFLEDYLGEDFQFPVGIRWCSDVRYMGWREICLSDFQFPVGIRWCSDAAFGQLKAGLAESFQFPVGIRWCSDE